jgi:ATP-dependent DNA helicase RecG
LAEQPDKDVLARDVRFLKGVGPRRAELLAKLGIRTLGDAIWHLPRDYEDRRHARPIRSLRPDQSAVVSGTIRSARWRPMRSRFRGILEVTLDDGTGSITLTWFNAQPSWEASYRAGERLTAYGPVDFYGGLRMVAPAVAMGTTPEDSPEFGRILPLYPMTEGMTQRIMRQVTAAALEAGAALVPDVLPREFCRALGLPGIERALLDVHFPPSSEAAQAARRRLAYEELLVFQTALALRRSVLEQSGGVSFKVGPNVDRRIRRLFPFAFTEAQDRVIAQVAADMRAERPMNRLLQGDVGCGKTVVAVYAMLAALAESSKRRQVALMAPTEILAEQHFLTLEGLLERARVQPALLTSGVDPAERERVLSGLASGGVNLIVGTHALIQEQVRFRNLALVVVDEQHRFGVRQRLALREKGPPPDVLIMTATPIPRTLALAYFADMDVSVIDQMPPGRSPVRTTLYMPPDWDRAFAAAREELAAGRRAFVIYPLVEENRDLDLTSAKEGYEQLSRSTFAGFSCCLLHGQMPPARKQQAMDDFRAGRCQVMAATTVVEVGIDVPEATVMIVQHAERLGLAQLHQLRGRIGRGSHPGRCFLLADPGTDVAWRRLTVLTETTDGFRIAEEDLRLRGPGQLFGTQQSGMPEFRVYDFSDPALLKQARDDAFALVHADPPLARPEHGLLRAAVMAQYGERFSLADVG